MRRRYPIKENPAYPVLEASSAADTWSSTKVMLPRFEYEEEDPTVSPYQNPVLKRAPYRAWLPGVEIDRLLDPQAIVASYPSEDRTGRWWGIYHRVQLRLTLGQLFHSPFLNTTNLYRSWYIKHSYLWDEQAQSGHSSEVLLERLRHDKPVFDEVMAIHTSDTLWSRDRDGGQQVVMRTDTGQWAEPRFNKDYPERDYNFVIMRELATRSGLDALEAATS